MPSKKARRVAGLLDVTLDAVLVRSASRQPKTEEAQAEQRERAGFGDHERIGKCDASASVGQLIEEGDLSGIVEALVAHQDVRYGRAEERIASTDHLVGHRIGMRKLIEQVGLSQREAANEIGVTQRTFRDWCAGKREPPRAVLMALELLLIKRKNQLLAGKLKTQVRTDGPFAIYAVTDDTLGKPDLRGYMIEGPGSYSSWLLSAEQVGPELEELKAKLGR